MKYSKEDDDKFRCEILEYMFTYEKNDILLSRKRNKNKGFYRVRCKYCKREMDIRSDHKIKICPKCCQCYENSFAYHIEVELEEDINKYWDWEKNNELGLNPYYISKKTDMFKIWIKCDKKNYHKSYETTCWCFTSNNRCPYCINKKLNYFDSVGFLYHQLSKSIVEDKRNNLTWEDMYKLTPHTGKKFFTKCTNCQSESDKKISLDALSRRITNGCEKCSDRVSTCEKFIINILKYLGVDFIVQYSPKWANNKKYDFYIPSMNIVIETHGRQHYENAMKWCSLEYQKENDKYKKELALKNGIEKYIVIDCSHSSLSWLKDNTIEQLKDIFDLNNIDWNDIYIKSLRNNVAESCRLWNKGYNTYDIAKILNIAQATVWRYLEKGKEFNLCDYNIEESFKRKRRRG